MTRDEVVRLLQAHRDELYALGARSVSLFGSVARDEAGPESDIDVLVEFEGKPDFDRYMTLLMYLEELLARRVDLSTPGMVREEFLPYVERDIVRVA